MDTRETDFKKLRNEINSIYLHLTYISKYQIIVIIINIIKEAFSIVEKKRHLCIQIIRLAHPQQILRHLHLRLIQAVVVINIIQM